ncbi:hypothetical protein FQN49_005658 [Arthroderma sp. PD_2]|nr:hypothetical protein FQN49_005658 [Arthroderma sp. PD_2]
MERIEVMSIPQVQIFPNEDIPKAIRDDILDHLEDTTYEALFFIPNPDIKYNYHITCEDFTTVCKDLPYNCRCIIQSIVESKYLLTAKTWLPRPQPFKTVRVPKDQPRPQSTP